MINFVLANIYILVSYMIFNKIIAHIVIKNL